MPTSASQDSSESYKFRELKTYSSTEWLADNKKKYRQVFDQTDTTYVYAELSFYNKHFDRKDWEVTVELRCYSLRNGRTQLCRLPFTRKVSRFDAVMYIREGWGNKSEGSFWRKGTYYWEAWIEGTKVGSKYFYIESSDATEGGSAGYLELKSMRLYEGPYEDIAEEDRLYYKTFDSEETRYIYAEIILQNRHPAESWQCELFTKFFNNSRELKGQVVRLNRIENREDLIHISAGWGSNVQGSWREDHYTAEVVFMDQLLAVVPFEVGDEFEAGSAPVILPGEQRFLPTALPDNDNASFEELLERLDSMIGLGAVKQQVRDHASYIQFLQLRKDKGFREDEQINVHSAFIGNPGTGKTTVAQMMGKLYKQMGLLSVGHVVEVDRVDLVGEYIGQTAPKVKEVIKKARGGVLFIDEAYSLARSAEDSKDFGREAIEILLKEMSDGEGDLAVIVAGYPKEMAHFLESNPGLRSRFKLFFEFDDYLPQELFRIADFAAERKAVTLTEPAKERLKEIIIHAFRERNRAFGNARYVFDLIEKSKINLGLRIMASEQPQAQDEDALRTIQVGDVYDAALRPAKESPFIPIEEDMLAAALDDLDKLVGLTETKAQIHEIIRLVRYYRQTERGVLHNFYLHTVFIGNPGTGKTTVARILTRIYRALGMLERGHMVETDRQGLVAGYVGQTSTKTAEKIDEAMGGVLFIDEAYALTGRAGGQDFGDEAVQTLLKRMEDNRGKFFVFVAGYPDNMERFLKANPGLNSRFDKVLKFEDYKPTELYEIGVRMLREEHLLPDPGAQAHLKAYFHFLHEYRDQYFGNARTVRGIITEVIKNYHLRLAELSTEARLALPEQTIELKDVQFLTMNPADLVFSRKTIGFQRRD